MSDSGDRMIEFEERHYDDLAEKFIEKNRDKAVIDWNSFVYEQFIDWCNSQEPPDYDPTEDK